MQTISLRKSTMARGMKKHLKRLNAPKHWMLDKLSGVFAPRPTPGPHKLRECLPLCIFFRNRLHYALTYDEVKKITMQRLVKVDGKVRTDPTYPAGFMDVITLEKTGEHFRLIYGRHHTRKDWGTLPTYLWTSSHSKRLGNTSDLFMDVITLEKTGEHFR